MKTYIFSFISTLFLMFFFSCCKDKTPPQQDLGFLSLGEAKDYMLFKQGTWWVYKNSLTQELDTMVLTSCSLDTFSSSSSKRKFTYEDIAYTIKSRRDGVTYIFYCLGLSAEVLNFKPGWAWHRNLIGKGQNGNEIVGIVYPFEYGRNGGNGSSETICKGKLDTFTVSKIIYNNIVEFDVSHDISFPLPLTYYIYEGGVSKYYYSKNYGLIKIYHQSWDGPNGKEVYMNWDLVECNIVK